MSAVNLQRSPVVTHLHIDKTVAQSSALQFVRNMFPLVGALVPKVGIPLRAVTDFTTVGFEKSFLSLLSIHALFFYPQYFKGLESFRSIILNLEEGYKSGNKSKQKMFQSVCHIMSDAANIGLFFYKDSLHLRVASFAWQFMGGLVDCKDAWDEGSKLKMGVHGGLTLLRAMNLAAAGQKLFQTPEMVVVKTAAIAESQPAFAINAEKTVVPEKAVTIREAIPATVLAPLLEQGTGSDALAQYSIEKYLGEDAHLNDLFLVKDINGELKILKRFLTDVEKYDRSYAYRFAHSFISVLTLPLSLFIDLRSNEAKRALEISALNDPHIIKVFQSIENKYSKETIRDGKTVQKTVKDLYHVMEYVGGNFLTAIKTVTLSQVREIVTTFLNVANLKNYFYRSSNLKDIKVVDESIKFTDLSCFNTPYTWLGCRDIYKNMESFFTSLVKMLPDPDRWSAKMKEIFTHSELVNDYDKASTEMRKVIEEQHKSIFTTDLLRSTLQRLQELFSGN